MRVQFASPIFLLLLLLAAYVLYGHIKGRLGAGSSMLFPSSKVAGNLHRTARIRLMPVLLALRIIAIALLALALARPQLGRAESIRPQEGIDIALALDLSFSMSERDMGGKSRLEAAKEVIKQFVGGREGDRIGLVVFAAEGATQSPMTSDYPELLGLIDKVDHGKLPEGTAIGNGMATSINLLRESRSKTKVIVLLTDGQNNSGEIDPLEAAKMAQLLDVRVYTIGVGGQPNTSARNRGPGSNPVDEATLRSVSETTGASYFRATDPNGLKDIYELIGRLEKSKMAEIRYTRVDDLWLPFIAGAFALLIVEIILSNSIFRRFP